MYAYANVLNTVTTMTINRDVYYGFVATIRHATIIIIPVTSVYSIYTHIYVGVGHVYALT